LATFAVDRMNTTYQSNHTIPTFDPSKSWILSSTSTPTQLKKPTVVPNESSAINGSSLNDLNVPTAPEPSLPLPSRFHCPPPDLSVKQHVLYHTSSGCYGSNSPSIHELPSVYYGHKYPFSSEFTGGMFRQSGLETGLQKSFIVNGKEEL